MWESRGGGEDSEKGGVTRFVSYNILNGHNIGLESALYVMVQANVDLWGDSGYKYHRRNIREGTGRV